MTMRETQLIVNLACIQHNAGIIKRHLGKSEICAVIKANAYGHGDFEVANALIKQGVTWFSVATIEEGVALRKRGLTDASILVLGGVFNENAASNVIKYDLVPTVFSLQSFYSFCRVFRSKQKVHVEIDTGMGRLGINIDELDQFIKDYKKQTAIEIEGVFTHFSHADLLDRCVNRLQLDKFTIALDKLKYNNIKYRHVANSAAILSAHDSYFDMVRPGLLIYGVDPTPSKLDIGLQTAMKWVTKPLQIKKLRKGDAVSYGGVWVAQRNSEVAILPVGYADGYSRTMSQKAQVIIKGKRVPVIGMICMDYIMIDVTDVPGVDYSDEAVLLGSQQTQTITFCEMSEWANTIPYEVMCNISTRVPRTYLSSD